MHNAFKVNVGYKPVHNYAFYIDSIDVLQSKKLLRKYFKQIGR